MKRKENEMIWWIIIICFWLVVGLYGYFCEDKNPKMSDEDKREAELAAKWNKQIAEQEVWEANNTIEAAKEKALYTEVAKKIAKEKEHQKHVQMLRDGGWPHSR